MAWILSENHGRTDSASDDRRASWGHGGGDLICELELEAFKGHYGQILMIDKQASELAVGLNDGRWPRISPG
jgi:hypothetical protein